jgi:hypothetical protein
MQASSSHTAKASQAQPSQAKKQSQPHNPARQPQKIKERTKERKKVEINKKKKVRK